MKHFAKLFFITFLLTITACNNTSNENKIDILTGDLTSNSFVELKSQDALDTLRETKQDFIVYAYVQGCSSCANFEIKLSQYIEDYGLTIYKINYTSVLSDSDPLKLAKGAAPAIGFYKEGKKLYIAGYNSDTREQFVEQSKFDEMMKKHVNLPSAFYISPNSLDTKKSTKQSFTVLFTRSSCGDCGFLFNEYLNNYLKSNKQKTLYLIECDKEGIRLDSSGNVNSEQWQEFKDKYQLSYTGSNEYGYETGVVPTFQYYKNGILSDSNIYVNEEFEYIASEEKILIVKSPLQELVNVKINYKATSTNESDIQREIYEYGRNYVKDAHNKSLSNFLSAH